MRWCYIALFFVSILFSCDQKECDPTSGDISGDNLNIPTIFYRTPAKLTLNYSPGDCDAPDSFWTLPGKSSAVKGTFQFAGQSTYGGEFTESGKVCVYMSGGENNSNEICDDISLVSTDIWSQNPNYTFPGTATNRTIALPVGDHLYFGFGEANEWYRFDTSTWKWSKRASVNLATFEAYTGFVLNNKACILGQNGFVYEYDEVNDAWASFAQFEGRLDTTFMLEQQSNIDNAVQFLYPFIGVGINDKAYFGVGSTGKFFEFDRTTLTWRTLPEYPDPGIVNTNYFVFEDKIYLGKYYYDVNAEKWEMAPSRYSENEFDKFFAVFDDGVYFQDSRGNTRRFDGQTTTTYAPRTIFNDELRASSDGVARVVTIGDFAFIPKHFFNLRKFTVFTFYKRN